MAEEHEILRREKVQKFFLEGKNAEDSFVEKWVDEFVRNEINENFTYDVD